LVNRLDGLWRRQLQASRRSAFAERYSNKNALHVMTLMAQRNQRIIVNGNKNVDINSLTKMMNPKSKLSVDYYVTKETDPKHIEEVMGKLTTENNGIVIGQIKFVVTDYNPKLVQDISAMVSKSANIAKYTVLDLNGLIESSDEKTGMAITLDKLLRSFKNVDKEQSDLQKKLIQAGWTSPNSVVYYIFLSTFGWLFAVVIIFLFYIFARDYEGGMFYAIMAVGGFNSLMAAFGAQLWLKNSTDQDRKSTRLNSSHHVVTCISRMPSSA
jgi:hypothetical protein